MATVISTKATYFLYKKIIIIENRRKKWHVLTWVFTLQDHLPTRSLSRIDLTADDYEKINGDIMHVLASSFLNTHTQSKRAYETTVDRENYMGFYLLHLLFLWGLSSAVNYMWWSRLDWISKRSGWPSHVHCFYPNVTKKINTAHQAIFFFNCFSTRPLLDFLHSLCVIACFPAYALCVCFFLLHTRIQSVLLLLNNELPRCNQMD